MATSKEERFSKIGFIFSMMGIAVGAGNIWRFPRIVAQNNGGAFLVAWLIFLFLWSIPLIIIELFVGRITRSPPFTALSKISRKNYALAGVFITVVTACILSYYSVVVGWGISYFFFSLKGLVHSNTNFLSLWQNYQESYTPLIAHLLSISASYFIIRKGISQGIEKFNLLLMPLFFSCMLALFIRALSLPGAFSGVKEMFACSFKDFLNYKIWIEALTQNAWDTGAGWGLLMVYASFAHKKESLAFDGCATAIANNIVSLFMGMIIFSSAASLDSLGINSLISGEGSSALGLTFIYLPSLLTKLPGDQLCHTLFSSLFFLAFSCAALSSLISMLFLISKTLETLGIKKTTAPIIASIAAFIMGIPSAISTSFFSNQDFVWGIALILNGLFILFAASTYGLTKIKNKISLKSSGAFKLVFFPTRIVRYILPLEGLFLLGWYLYESFEQNNWWQCFSSGSLSNILLQWSVPVLLYLFLRPYHRLKSSK